MPVTMDRRSSKCSPVLCNTTCVRTQSTTYSHQQWSHALRELLKATRPMTVRELLKARCGPKREPVMFRAASHLLCLGQCQPPHDQRAEPVICNIDHTQLLYVGQCCVAQHARGASHLHQWPAFCAARGRAALQEHDGVHWH